MVGQVKAFSSIESQKWWGGQISKWGLGLGLAKTVLVKPALAVQNLAKNSTILKEKKNSHLQDILLYKK